MSKITTSYEKIAKETRKEVSKISLEQQREVSKIYKSAVDNISTKISKSSKGSISEKWLVDYQTELKATRKSLNTELNKSIKGYTTKAARVATEAEKLNVTNMFASGGLEVSEKFTSMFSGVQTNIVNDIIKGDLYKDNKTLSNRIWSHGKEFEKDIQYIIAQGIAEKKSANELSKDLEQFVKNPNQRDAEWGKTYKALTAKQVQYRASRLARTSINHAYQNATIQSSSMNPFVKGIKWVSAMVHGRTCELCIERATTDQFGLGVGVFPKDEVPLDHANGWCTMIPYITQSLDDIADEIHNWVDGGNNPMLDDWYDKHGDYFVNKTL